MALFKPSELKELQRHAWARDPGLLSLIAVDDRRLKEIAAQIGVPMPDRVTTSQEVRAGANLPGEFSGFGTSHSQRAESIYEQPPFALALRRVIDRLFSRDRVVVIQDARLRGHPALPRYPSLRQIMEAKRRFPDLTRAMAGQKANEAAVRTRSFVIAEEIWVLRTQSPLALWSVRSFDETEDGRTGIEVQLDPLVTVADATRSTFRRFERRDRLLPDAFACVFGDALASSEDGQHILIRPIAVFDRRGGDPEFSWILRARRQR